MSDRKRFPCSRQYQAARFCSTCLKKGGGHRRSPSPPWEAGDCPRNIARGTPAPLGVTPFHSLRLLSATLLCSQATVGASGSFTRQQGQRKVNTVVVLRCSRSLTWRQSHALCTTSDTLKPSKIQDTSRSSLRYLLKYLEWISSGQSIKTSTNTVKNTRHEESTADLTAGTEGLLTLLQKLWTASNFFSN